MRSALDAATGNPISTVFTLDNSTLQGITLSNNQILWSFAGDGTLVNSPIAVNNYVFIGSSSGNLYALTPPPVRNFGLRTSAPLSQAERPAEMRRKVPPASPQAMDS